MKRILAVLIFVMFAAVPVVAQTGAVQNHCFKGGTMAVTSGLSSTNYLDGIIPSCKITVYLTGTTNKATIYADGISTPLDNPFTAHTAASVDPGGWIFWAATNAGLDVVMSGGIAPNTYAQPVTLTAIYPNSSFSPVVNPLSIKTNTVGNADQTVLNFTDTATVKFTNPSGGLESATVPDATNSSKGAVQCDGTTTTCTAGVISANPSASLIMQTAPPAAGTYIRVDPSGVTVAAPDTQYLSAGSLTSANVRDTGCTLGGCLGTGPAQVTWTFTLPSYVVAGNVTAAWASTTARAYPTGNNNGSGAVGVINCSKSGGTPWHLFPVDPNGYGPFYNLQQFNTHMTDVSGSDIATVTCFARVANGSVVQNGLVVDVPQIYLQLADSVDTAPASNTIQVAPPLYFNQSKNTLGLSYPLDVLTDTGASNAYVVSNSNMSTVPGQTIKFVPTHNSTSTTPTLVLNGIPANTIVGPTGAALASGDLVTTAVASVIVGPDLKYWLQNPQTAAASSTVNVNGSPVSGPNFNGSTPAAGSNGKNIAFQVSSSNVSGEVVGDGNAAHYLDGAGNYSTPAGTGTLTSINSQTGPAITLQSTGGTVTITTPTSDHINLEAAASASGVQYNPTSTQYIFTGDSENVDDDHVKGGTLITVTNVNCNGTVCIFTNSGTNGFAAGDWVFTDLITSPGFFSCSTSITGVCNLFQVLSAGLSTTQFEIAYTANTGTGTGGQVENANYFLPFLTCNQPFFKNHGACFVSIPVGATLVSLDTNFATAITAYATGTPTYLLINGGKNDIQNCDSAATIEGHLQSIWAKAHTAGLTVIQGTITPSRWNTAISLGCPTAFTTLQSVNGWMTTQRRTAANASSGQYIDRLVNMQAILNDMNSTFWFQSGPSLGSLSDKGTAQQAMLINEEMSTQGDAQRGYPQQIIPAPFGKSLAVTADGYGFVPPFVDSTNAFTFYSRAGTELFRIDTSTLSVFSKAVSGGGGGCVTADNGTGFMHTNGTACLTSALGDPGANGIVKRTAPNTTAITTNTDISGLSYAAGGGTGDAQTITLSPAIAAYTAGLKIRWKPNAANTITTPTIAVSGLATITAVKCGSTALVANDWTATAVMEATYDGTNFQVTNPQAVGCGSGVTTATGTAPIQVNGNSGTPQNGPFTVSCPTCSVGSGTSVQINSGSALGSLAMTGDLPLVCADSSGSGTVQTCTTSPSFTPQANNCLVYTTTTTNSGTGLTLNIDSFGAKSIAVPGVSGWTTTLTANAIPANKPLRVCYDGTNLNVQSTGVSASASAPVGKTYITFNPTPVTLPGSVSAFESNQTFTVPSNGYLGFNFGVARQNAGDVLNVEVAATSSSCRYDYALQTDGNQVLYSWTSGGVQSAAIGASGAIGARDYVGDYAGFFVYQQDSQIGTQFTWGINGHNNTSTSATSTACSLTGTVHLYVVTPAFANIRNAVFTYPWNVQ